MTSLTRPRPVVFALALAACPGGPATPGDTDPTGSTSATTSSTSSTSSGSTTDTPDPTTTTTAGPTTSTAPTTSTTTSDATTADPAEAALWIRPLFATGDVSAHSVALTDTGDVLVAGAFAGELDLATQTLTSAGGLDLFLARFSAGGELLWAHAIGGVGNEHEATVRAADDGRILLVGEFTDTVALPGLTPIVSLGATDILLAQLTADGHPAWIRGLGGPGVEMEPRVEFDPAGDILLSSIFEATVDLGGEPLVAVGARDLLVARLDPDGQHLWSTSFPGPGDISNHDLAVAASGDLAITGWSGHDIEFGGDLVTGGVYLVVLDGDTGAHRWSRGFGDGGNNGGCGVRFADDGGLLLTGWFQDTIDFGAGPLTAVDHSDHFVARHDDAGALVWASGHGGLSVDSGCALGRGAHGDWIVGGNFTDQIDLGGGPLGQDVGACGFLASLADQDGAHRWSMQLCGASGGRVDRLVTYPEGHVVFVAQMAGPTQLFGQSFDAPKPYTLVAHVPIDLLEP